MSSTKTMMKKSASAVTRKKRESTESLETPSPAKKQRGGRRNGRANGSEKTPPRKSSVLGMRGRDGKDDSPYNFHVADISDKVAEIKDRDRKMAEDSSQPEPAERRKRAKIIAFYNFKGGVGKTSNLINIAGMLTLQHSDDELKQGLRKRVLMVDADPQCNLTSFFTPNPPDEEAEDPYHNKQSNRDGDDDDSDTQCKTESDEEELPRASDQLPQVMRSRVTGPASRRYPQPRAGEERDPCDKQVDSSYFKRGNELPVLEVAQGFLSKEPYNVKNIYQLLNPVFGNRVDRFGPPERVFAVSNALPGLYLIPGDPQIATFESKIAFRRAQPDVAVAQLGAFRKLLLDTAEALDIDVVLVDFGPSASALMKIMLLSCDFVLPPVFTDYFSLSSMDGLLTRVLPDMIQEHRAILQDQDFVKVTNDDVRQQLRMGFGFSRNVPRLLPFTVTNFNTCRRSVTANASVFIASMHELIKSDAALENKMPRVPEAVRQLYTRKKHLMVVAVCKKLGQLQDIAHKTGYPPVAHTQELLAHWGQSTKHWMKNPYINQVLYAREKYAQYCKFILDQCFALPHRSLSDGEA